MDKKELEEVYKYMTKEDIKVIQERDIATLTRIGEVNKRLSMRNDLTINQKNKRLKQYKKLIDIYSFETINR